MTLEEGAKNIIFTSLGIRKGEKVLVLTDVDKKRIASALFQAALEAGAEPVMIKIPMLTRHGEEPPAAVSKIMTEFDAAILVTQYSLSHTEARKRATRAGVRIAALPGITEQIFSDGGIMADYGEVARTIQRVYKVVKAKNSLKLTTKLGTNVELVLKGRAWITDDTGLCQEPGHFMTLPAGEIFIAPVEGLAKGTLIIDGVFGRAVEEPVNIKIEKGYAVEITGAEDIAKELDRRGKEGRNIAKFGLGLNPSSRLLGHPLEDLKVLGTAHIGFGDNSTFGGKVKCGIHIDGVIKSPTVIVDTITVMKDGKLVL